MAKRTTKSYNYFVGPRFYLENTWVSIAHKKLIYQMQLTIENYQKT